MAATPGDAPPTLRAQVPRNINPVIGTLTRQPSPASADLYLRQAIATTTRHIHAGLAVVSVITYIVVMLAPGCFLVPAICQDVNDGTDHPHDASPLPG